MCHRMAAHHHCEMMGHQDDSDSEPESAVTSHPGDCPMDCCMRDSAGTGIAAVSITAAPLLLIAQDRVSYSTVLFTSNGFSSHTDRGPPAKYLAVSN
jgi:hypothetical protein